MKIKLYFYVVIALWTRVATSWASIVGEGGEGVCSEQLFCSCPPFLRHPGTQQQLHFTKHNYDDQYAILGKAKELHCCVGPGYTQLLWYKDGEVFPWAREEGRARSAVLYSNNQSLIMLEVGAEDAGRFRCEAVSAAGRRLGHTTRLRTFPPPVFAHPPIWNTQPEDVRVRQGGVAEVVCGVTVGQQYNTVSMQPVHAAWTRFGREIEEGDRVAITQTWTDDDIVIQLKLEISDVRDSDAGDYSCKVKNEYGDLERTISITVDNSQESFDGDSVKKEMAGLFRKQLKLYSSISRYTAKHQQSVQDFLRKAEMEWN